MPIHDLLLDPSRSIVSSVHPSTRKEQILHEVQGKVGASGATRSAWVRAQQLHEPVAYLSKADALDLAQAYKQHFGDGDDMALDLIRCAGEARADNWLLHSLFKVIEEYRKSSGGSSDDDDPETHYDGKPFFDSPLFHIVEADGYTSSAVDAAHFVGAGFVDLWYFRSNDHQARTLLDKVTKDMVSKESIWTLASCHYRFPMPINVLTSKAVRELLERFFEAKEDENLGLLLTADNTVHVTSDVTVGCSVNSFFYCIPSGPQLIVSNLNGKPSMVVCRHPFHASTVGLGAFALRAFKRDDVITFFVGERVTDKDLDTERRGREQYALSERFRRITLDPFGLPPGQSSFAHCINTCGGPLADANNAEFHSDFAVRATKNIALFEEILVPYDRRRV